MRGHPLLCSGKLYYILELALGLIGTTKGGTRFVKCGNLSIKQTVETCSVHKTLFDKLIVTAHGLLYR